MSALPPLLEREVSRTTCAFLKAEGWRVIRMNVTRLPLKGQWVSFGEKGMPDFEAIYYLRGGHAIVWWLEFKRERGGKASAAQFLWAENEKRLGAVVIQVESFDQFHSLYRKAFDHPDSPVRRQRELMNGQ
jgi:hypothetical protein